MSFSQLDDIADIAQDLVFLADQYVSPAADASVYQFSGGWYTSANKKDLWDLEFSLQGNLLFIPNRDKNFLINEADLINIGIKGDATSGNTPSALGGTNTIELEGSLNDETFEFDSPQGVDETYIKHAQIQATLGLWYGTSFIARYSPKIQINKTYYQILGFGLQHNISQWFSEEPKLNIASLITYSFYTIGDNFTPVSLPLGQLDSVIVDGRSLTLGIIASKQFDRLIVSSAIGLSSSNFDYEVGGEGALVINTLNQALSTLNESSTNFKVDLGLDYRLGDFSINSMLTFGNYANLLFGLNYNL